MCNFERACPSVKGDRPLYFNSLKNVNYFFDYQNVTYLKQSTGLSLLCICFCSAHFDFGACPSCLIAAAVGALVIEDVIIT